MLAWIRRAASLAAALSVACSPPAAAHAPATGATSGGTNPELERPSRAADTASHASADASEQTEEEGEEGIDDVETALPPDATITVPHPLDGVSPKEIDRRVVDDPRSLGSISVGKPNAGRLINGVQMPPGDAWDVVVPGTAWATQETIDSLKVAISEVMNAFPGTPKLPIGDISAENGGYLSPHLSHQAGRDVDIGYYYVSGQKWYRRANAENLDLRRTWAFVRALVTDTDVEMLLIDHGIQQLIRGYAESIGENREWLDLLFRGKGAVPPLIRHAPGHATHIHIRFYSPIAQETARRAYASLVRHGKVPVGAAFAVHIAKKGETLAQLAKRYHTTIRAIRQANGLKSNLIQAKKTYRIPSTHRSPPSVQVARIVIPPRRLPPSDTARPAVSSG